MKPLHAWLVAIAAAGLSVTGALAGEPLQPAMQNMAREIEQLKPYLLNPKRFAADENQAQVNQHLERLKIMAENAKHSQKFAEGDYQQTISLLVDHLNETQKTYQRGHRELARYMLQAGLQTCIQCHSRLPGYENKAASPASQKTTPPTFEESEFLFATRDFSGALSGFERLVQGYPQNHLEPTQLLDALDYIATIYTRLKRDPAGAVASFQKLGKQKSMPAFVQEDLSSWVESFRAWQREPNFRLEDHTDAEAIAKAKEILGARLKEPLLTNERGQRIAYLRASSLLHEFLILRPKSPLAGEADYLLGICYISLRQNFFVGFEQMYLRACIRDFKKQPIAQQCYHLLEEYIYQNYSGSSGTHIPYEVMQELNEYKKYIH